MLKIFKIGLFVLLLAIFIAFASSHVFAISADVYEPDNNFTAANAIPTNGSLQHHSFHAGGDEDWVKFNTTNGTFYTIETTNLLNDADTFIDLYDSDGTTLIDSNDDISPDNLASKIVYQANASETNYVKIRHFSSSGTGNYSIDVKGIPQDQYEPDNNFTAANAIPTNGSLQHHSFHAGGDEDWIKLNVTNQSFYTIKTTNLLNNADTFVFLYDSDGTTLIDSNDDINKDNLASKIVYQADANETNYVKIRHFSSSGTGNYSISVILWGSLVPSLVSPTAELIVQKNKSFDFVSSVRCVNGSCGNVTAALHLSNENNNLFSLSIDLEEYGNNYAYTAHSSRENYDYKIRSALSDAKNINDEQIGVDVENLELEDIDMHNNDVYVKYSQKYELLPVYGGIVKLLLRDNKIIGANNRFFEDIDIETEPAISKEEAESIASDDNLEIFDSELVVYPKNGQFFLAWKVDVFDSKDQSVALRVFVDAHTGEIIDTVDMIIHNTASGTVTGMIIPEHVGQKQIEKPFKNQFVRIVENGVEKAVVNTSSTGDYSLSGLSGNVTIEAFLQGPFVKVINGKSAEANHSFNATAPFTHNWNWNDSDKSDRQEESNMFYHVNFVHDYFTMGTPFNINSMNYQIVATVEAFSDCNAGYNSLLKDIRFGNGTECNAALMSDIIYHEYTHGVVDHVYTEGLLEDNEGGAMHEGYADYFAATINNNSCLGIGGTSTGETCLRNVNNSLMYEDLKDEEIHDFGMVFGGSLWDLRENLSRDSADSLAIRAMKLEPVTMPEFLDSLLIVDDDNADLADKTPNYDAICEAFSTKHHIISANCGDDGIVPENSGGFFYTVNPNPINDACLSNMTKNDVCSATWTVNATNAPKGRWKFFAVYSNEVQSARTNNATILIEGPPDLNPISVNEIAQEDSLFSFNASTISGSNPPHTFSTSNNTKYTVTKISDTKAKISFTPTNNDVPSVALTVFVTDNQGLTDSEQVIIQVNNTNDAPFIVSAYTPYSNPKIHSSKNITFNVTASDPDEKHGDALTVKWYVNGTLNTSGNKLIFSPDGKIGLYKVLANVTDKENASAFKEWLLTVAERPIAETFVPNETTDFSKIPDLSNAVDVKIGKAEGKISFNVNLDLRFVVDLDNLINISKGFISIDTSQLPELNKSAILAMKNLGFSQKPLIHVDDGSGFVPCPSELCKNISYINNTLSFQVGHFSAYMAVENTTKPIPSSKLSIKKVKAIIDSKSETVQEGEKIDDAKPGSEVKLKIKVENLFSNGKDSDIEDISVELSIEDMDDGEDLEEEADEFDLGADDEEEIEIDFTVPFDVEEDTYDVLITAEGEDENKTAHKSEFNFGLEVEKESHEIKISRLELSPSEASCGKDSELKIAAVNSGSKDEDSAVVLAYSPELSLDFKEEGIELDENEAFSKSITIPISNDVLPGIYPINAKAYYSLNKISDEKTISLEVGECVREETKKIAALAKIDLEDKAVEVLYAASEREGQNQAALAAKYDNGDDEAYVMLLLVSHIILIGLIIFLAGVLIITKKR